MKTFHTKTLTIALVGTALVIVSSTEIIDSVADTNLLVHHGQHLLIILGGTMIGYAITSLYGIERNKTWSRVNSVWARLNRRGYIAGALFMAAFNFWHIPSVFVFTILEGNESIHFLEHVTFFSTSVLLIAVTPFMSRAFKALYIFVFGNMNSMMGVLYSVSGSGLFYPYPAYQQDQFGFLMSLSGLLTMTLGTFLYLYVGERRLTTQGPTISKSHP
jgi:hypothetical protein